MIPADLAARLRTLTEASFFNTSPPVAGLQRAREIQALLPELQQGQRFFATLLRTLPDGSFRAVVAGKEMTLALNTSAKPGDTLELETSRVTQQAVFARVVGNDAASANASAQPALSQTGRLISFLLTGQPSPPPANLAGNQPLLTAPPTSGAPLVPLLRQALGQSGLFYESHQAEWVLGTRDGASLMREPQAQVQAQAGHPAAGGRPTGTGSAAPQAAAAHTAATGGGQASAADGSERTNAALRVIADDAAPVRSSTSAPIPERLLPVVHQQLEALATHQYVWQGQAWPGQQMEWIIDDPERDDGEDDNTAQDWNTTLRLSLPRLGSIEAHMQLTPAGVALRLRSNDDASIVALDAGAARLAESLEAAGLKLTGLVVERRDD
ncbi:flagellar hook-length control protein FliK [Thauera sp. Sel9]|uniref:flagellar hook-length control protein FliK n=1 Tax=Thauera sp. Sel9 TaxID=2974299 RepID=UPI0021E12AB5|nr:flagellar hook-length control protein FliK [Thauera sp. Sel9]MCV2216430.1 flagellar hook-length control protein FliK [Thauera sp. Sel9]